MPSSYNAIVKFVFDGATIACDIDLGFGVWVRGLKVNLRGVEVPDMKVVDAEGIEVAKVAKAYLISNLLNRSVEIQSYKDQTVRYRKWLVDIFAYDSKNVRININDKVREVIGNLKKESPLLLE